MNQWIIGCSRIYRRLARAFPHDFRMVCGDGLEQLGVDFVPLIWREQGVLGLVRCFADLTRRLPLEYVSSWTSKFKEMTMTGDLFEGTWKAKNDESQFRATFGTRLSADGVGIGTIMALMGHQDAKTCLRYVRATDRAKQEAVKSAFRGESRHKRNTKLRLVIRGGA